jgi:long-chain acyl-CoA synthetase
MSRLWDTSSIQPCNDIVMAGETIPAMFWNAVIQRGPDVWMRQKHLGLWRSWTWNQTADAVREIAGGLMSLGFAKGDCASILSNTVVEWVWADLAVLSAGGVSNGVYPTDAASQLKYLCEDSRTTVLFVEDDEQLDKALEVRADLPACAKLWCLTWRGCVTWQTPT